MTDTKPDEKTEQRTRRRLRAEAVKDTWHEPDRVTDETLRQCAAECECPIHIARTLMARELIALRPVFEAARTVVANAEPWGTKEEAVGSIAVLARTLSDYIEATS